MSDKRILVITNSGSFRGFLIRWLADCWSDLGYQVEFTADLKTRQDADIAFLHVDLTEVPAPYLAFSKRFPVVINANNCSVSKELFSHKILQQHCGYKGAVIVKTKENYGGLAEFRTADISWCERNIIHLTQKLALSRSINNRFIKYHAWKKLRILDPGNYPVFNSVENTPLGVWDNPRLMVEKFLPEQLEDGRYALRHWYFLGDKEFCRTLICKEPIPKWKSMNDKERKKSREEWWNIEVVNKADIPPEVRAVREKLQMDFGRIDWALHNGKPVVFDANKTPSGLGEIELDTELGRQRYSIIKAFSAGIGAFID